MDSTVGISPEAFEQLNGRTVLKATRKRKTKKQQRGRKSSNSNSSIASSATVVIDDIMINEADVNKTGEEVEKLPGHVVEECPVQVLGEAVVEESPIQVVKESPENLSQERPLRASKEAPVHVSQKSPVQNMDELDVPVKEESFASQLSPQTLSDVADTMDKFRDAAVSDKPGVADEAKKHLVDLKDGISMEEDSKTIAMRCVEDAGECYANDDGAPSPASTLGAHEEISLMDMDTNVDDILECIPNLPDDGSLSPAWSNYVETLTDTIKVIANTLRGERVIKEKQVTEIETLTEEVAKLRQELEVCKKWQNTVYVDMEKTIMQYQQYYQSMTYMYMGYPNYQPVVQGNAALPNGVPHVTFPAVCVPPINGQSVVTPPSNNNVSNNADANQSDVDKAKKAVTESAAVPYGDSSKSKKLAERKRFKAKSNVSSTVEYTNCNSTIPPIEETKTTNMNSVNGEVTTIKIEDTAVEPASSLMECTGDSKREESLIVSGKSIEETLREAAESVVSKSGFVYDENSGQYYDWNLKMYYDPSTQLYFDHENGIYYYYDNEKKSYIFHAQVKIDTSSNSNKNDDLLKVKAYDSEPSDGEIISDSESVSNEIPSNKAVSSEPEVPVDPCIRIIVVQSDSLDLGSLFVITCKGGTIGRDPSCTICVTEDKVSRTHCYIMYDPEDKTYYIQDNITRNGTFLNFERLAESKIPSEPVEITHRDLIKVGETMLSFHIHCRETCHDCEPGNIQAIIAREQKYNEIVTREDLCNERKRQAKNMRKKYGITPGYLPKSLLNSIPDRAGQRRKEHGIEAYENTNLPVTKASVVREIPTHNKGHQMLSKMGWKSGEGLGKSGTGIVSPLTVSKLGNAGKGLGGNIKTSLDQVGNNKALNWEKARQRYNKCE